MLKKVGILLVTLGSLLLSGCLSTTKIDPHQQWDGRFSVIAERHHQKENLSGRFNLMILNNHQILDLKTSIGNTLARIEQIDEKIRIQALGHDEIIANDQEGLMTELLGFHVPVNGLKYWIDGEALPNQDVKTEPNKAPYQRIEQMGWDISYTQYDDNGYPRRIVLQRPETVRSPALKITLVIAGRQHGTP